MARSPSLFARLGRNVLALSAVSLLTDVASEMTYPLLPVFLATVLGASATSVGVIEGAAESTAALLKLASGWWSDRAPRRKPLVVLGYGIASAIRPLIGLAQSVSQVLAIRVTDRVGKGLRSSPRDALIADSVDPAIRGRAFGFHRASDHAGAVIGPLLAFAILRWSRLDLRTVFLLTAIPGALALAVLLFGVREVPRALSEASRALDMKTPLGRRFWAYLGVLLLFTLGNSTDAFLLLRANQLGVAPALIPILWAMLHVVKSGSSVPGGALSDRLGRRPLIVAGWLLYAAVYFAFGRAAATWHAWALFAVYGLYFGLTEGVEKALVAGLGASRPARGGLRLVQPGDRAGGPARLAPLRRPLGSLGLGRRFRCRRPARPGGGAGNGGRSAAAPPNVVKSEKSPFQGVFWMYIARRLFVFSCLIPALLAAGAVRAQAPDPAALQAAIAGARLDPARAVTLRNVKLGVGLGKLSLDEGVLIPATAVGGKTIEMVFLGKGRIEVEPPDAIEGGQLELFTGGSRLDEEFKEAVLVVGQDAAASAMLKRPAVAPDADQTRRAEALYADWRKKGEWKYMSVERGMLLNALHDPVAAGYFAAWFRGGELGDIFYCVQPGEREQVTVGHFIPIEATDKEKRKLVKQISREQRKGRLLGVEVDDLGQWDTWLSASLRTAAGKPAPGAPTYESKKYTLDVNLTERDLRLTGKARIDLEPVIAGSRAVSLILPSDFQVGKVTDPGGAPLFYLRKGGELTVILPQAPPSGGTASVVVEYSGRPVDKDWNLFTLLDTMGWYPHAGSIDRAPYDVTFHWPKGLELVSSGHRMDGGESPDGTRWERRTLDYPAFGFSFEIGRFRVETAQAGHVAVRFAFGNGSGWTGRGVREEVMKAVTDSLQFYEEKFGPYPLDELTVTTANRNFSQGMLGFVTLANGVMNDLGVWNRFFGVEDRRLVIAHEVAHQWWGDQVGWTSYRDQWISEAMAGYAALLFGKERLGDKYSGVDLTSGWRSELTASLPDGRSLESIGPVVLGARLFSSHSDDAYEAIVYKKGAVILDMLARGLGAESFPKILKQIVKVENGRTISTEDFFTLIERITSQDLKAFTSQFVYATGLPQVLYNYRFEKNDKGWVVKGEARQDTPHRFHYKVVKTPRGTFDVAAEAVREVDIKQSTLVVPVDLEVYDPKKGKGKGKDGANTIVRGNILVKGESTAFEIPVEHEPKAFYLDQHAKVFGLFFDENRHPKRMLYYRGLKAAVEGKAGEAVALYDKALNTEEPPPDTGETVYYADLQYARRVINAQIELGRARLLLDQGKDDEADTALGKANYLLGDDEEFKILRSRLDVRRGNYDKAFQRLRKGQESSEGYALMAISARATGHKEELDKALKKARENGADVSLLAGS